jgi:hypothetical protein
MKTKIRNRKLKALALLLSLMLPLILNAAHYLLFRHHEQNPVFSLQLKEKESSHILCSYPFVTEEFTPASIEIQRPEFILHTRIITNASSVKSLNIFTVQGRAPPALA